MTKTVILPAHVGFILDGNRRWAREQELPTLEGHKVGLDNFNTIASYAFKRGISCVSAFVFSTENWKRTEEEVGYLMNLVTRAIDNYLNEFHKEGIKIVILGRRDGLRSKVLKAILRAEEATKDNTNGTLALCFNYGGQEEIVDAAKELIRKGIPADSLTKEDIAQALYGPEVPDVDLVIRTSGEHRMSGYMMWRTAYSEVYFSEKYWPSFEVEDLEIALDDYANRERRFGS